MSQISYEAYKKIGEERDSRSATPRVGYFSLKNDGDEAIVRILHDSTADFDMVVVHPVQIEGRWRNVNCIREPHEPIANCPLCAAEQPLRSKIYIHVLEYIKKEDGSITGVVKLWERPASYVTKLKNLIDQYGPLSDSLFKIKRNGAAGSMETSYDIMYAPPMIFKPEVYRKDIVEIPEVKAIGSAVLVKTAEQMQEILNPETAVGTPTKQAEPIRTYTPSTPAQSLMQTPPASANLTNVTTVGTPATQAPEDMVRPRRYY